MPKKLKISKRLSPKSPTKYTERYFSTLNVSELKDSVSEDSLKVWSELPVKIRQDPILAVFKTEHERLHGKSSNEVTDDSENGDYENDRNSRHTSSTHEDNTKETEFVTIRVNKEVNSVHGIGNKSEVYDATDKNRTSVASTQAVSQPESYRKYARMVSLLVIWLLMTSILATTREKSIEGHQVVVPVEGSREFTLWEKPANLQFKLLLKGAFLSALEEDVNETNYVELQFQVVDQLDDNASITLLDIWKVATVSPDLYESTKIKEVSRRFKLTTHDSAILDDPTKTFKLFISKTSKFGKDELFSMELFYNPEIIDIHTGALFGALILIVMYVLIIWEIVHRTFASMISATMAIAVLAIFGDRPTMEEIVVWMDMDSLLLLFSMMTLVAILTETGIFDYIAVLTFEISNGKIWPLIHCLCLITCFVSGFLDNVTTVLLMTPITIRLCEVMKLDPVPILMAIVVHANIGGTMTPIGDPPNIIITNNHYIQNHGVNFITFIAHMVPGVVLVVVQTSLHFRYIFRDIHNLRLTESEDLKNLRREITVWKRAAGSINSYSKDADVVKGTLLQKVHVLRRRLKKMETAGTVSTDDYNHTLENLRAMYPIKNKPLLFKSASALIFTVLVFFVESVPSLRCLSLGWAALVGVILLLIISGRDDMDSLVARIEWTTLLFFAAMFVTMESLSRLGLITWIGHQTENIILSVPQDSRLGCAIFLVLWISALSSAFVDSIPITAMMVKVVVALAENEKLNLPLQPLVWALTFGPCLGGNGTVYGASANVVCAGIAEQHGYKISFMKFFKIVFPMMLSSVIVITVYLLFSHVLLDWH